MPTRSPLLARARKLVITLALVATILASFAATGSSGATSGKVVTATILTVTTITNDCTSSAATQFGAVLPGGRATTATGTGRCTVSWQSSGSSQLRIAQSDGTGSAMSGPGTLAGTTDWSRYTTISSLDGSTAIAGGAAGSFYRTSTTGASWDATAPLGGNSNEIDEVEMDPSDATIAWVVGAGSRLQRVTSATTAPTPTDMFAQLDADGWPGSASPMAIAVLDADSIVVGGTSGWMGRTDDNGTSWTTYQLPGVSRVNDLTISPAGHIWAATAGSSGGNVWRTPLAGANAPGDWTQFATASGGSGATAVLVTGPSNGYLVGNAGMIYRYNGTSWSWRGNYDLESRSLEALSSPTGSPAIAHAYGDDGTILRTGNGGDTWTRIQSPVGTMIRAAIAGPAWVLAAGNARSVVTSSDSGATFSFQFDDAPGRTRRDVAVDPVNGRIVLAVGSRGAIWRSIDGGGTWTDIDSDTNEPLFGVTFATSTLAWAVGANGTLLRSEDAGLTWDQLPVATTETLFSIEAPIEHRFVAVGDAGTVVRTADGAHTITVSSAGTSVRLADVAMGSQLVGVAVGGTRVLRTTDGGATWTLVSPLPSTVVLRGASMPDPQTAFVLPAWDAIWRSDDAGASFTSHPIPSFSGNAVDAASQHAIHAAGSHLATSIDGGLTWTKVTSPGSSLQSVAASDANHVVAGATAGGAYSREASGDAGVSIANYGGAPNSWATSSQAMFGVCVQAIGAQSTIKAPWVVDGDTCRTTDSDPWRGVPAAATPVANVWTPGETGSVDLVWGVRFPAAQPPGQFTAGVSFEAVSPAV